MGDDRSLLKRREGKGLAEWAYMCTCDHPRALLSSTGRTEGPRADWYLFYPRGRYSSLRKQTALPIHFPIPCGGHISKAFSFV